MTELNKEINNMTEQTKTNVEVLTEQLDKGYTAIEGLVVRTTWAGLEIIKLNNNCFRGESTPVSMTLGNEELQSLGKLAEMVKCAKEGKDKLTFAGWKADDILVDRAIATAEEF